MQLKNMEKSPITFNDLPAAVSYLVEKVDRLESLLEKQQQAPVPEPTSTWMDVKELQAFLPTILLLPPSTAGFVMASSPITRKTRSSASSVPK